jgi:hypothetical protein
VYPAIIAVGGFILLIGGVLLYVGIKTPEGEKVPWGLGTYYDRTGICLGAIMVLFVGALAFTYGLFSQG